MAPPDTISVIEVRGALKWRSNGQVARSKVVDVARRNRSGGARSYTTRRKPFISTGVDRVQAEPRIQAGTSAAPKGRLSQ
jgi:hypothetical protein